MPTSTSSVFVVESVSPQGAQTIKNLTVRLTFNRDVDDTTAEDNITIAPTAGGDAVAGVYTVSGDRVSFRPSALCYGYDDEYCFDSDTGYTVSLGSGLKSSDGLTISCGGLYDSCDYAFTSGDLVDTTDPEVTISYPENGNSISVNSTVTLQATVTDDGGVSLVEFYVDGELIDTVQPDGDTPLSYSAEVDWDTSALTELERYDLYAIAYDVNDHSAQSDKIRVTARAEHCFNGSIDEDETAEDCGGEDCGACGGDSCDSDDDCQSGVCTDGVCIDAPEITEVSPESGAVGTYVTVAGNNFGSRTGTVLFGSTEVDLADCDDAWSNDQVIVVVPSTFASGEEYTITLVTADGYTDTTQDENGNLIGDFAVNDTAHPGLCSLNPDSGLVGDIVTFTGVNFGSAQSSSVATFGDAEADAYTEWSDTRLKATVPTLTADDYSTVVYVGGEVSNEIDFTVEDADAGEQPTIGLLDPDSGSEGEYVTISGSAFGSSIGLVYFTNNNDQSTDYGLATVADVDFPAACEDSYWSRDQIIVKVPEGLEATSYLVSVTRKDDATSNTADFTVTSGTAGPGVCSLEPTAGPAGYEGVTLSGERFGQTDGTVTFFDEQSAEVTSWSDGEVIATVPDGAATGAVTLTDEDGTDSNDTNFEVGDCNEEDLCDANTQQCCSSGACVSIDSSCPEDTSIVAEYVWEFSTGIIPTVPTLQVGCSDEMISPTPWDGRNGGDSVCVNAGISGTFDVDMDEDSYVLNDSIALGLCTDAGDDPCATTQAVTLDTLTTSAVSFSAYPAASLAAAATYQVTLTSDITSSSGTAIATTTWTFVTSSDAGDCDIYGVNVTPSSETIEESEETATFNAQALSADACVILNSADTDWTWATDGTYAALTSDSTCSGAPSACQMAIGLQEGDSYMIAEEDSEGFDDDADLLINFTDPYAVDYWPSCSGSGTACVNAAVGAEFNTAMDETSVETPGNVVIYWCSDESCTSYVEDMTGTVDLEDADPTMLSIGLTHDLEPTQYYQVIISGDIKSESGIPLSEYYGGDFSWTFLTRSDSEPCAIGSVVMSPTSATVTYVGATAVFTSVPYSDANDCSVSGERLDPESYSWSWSVDNATIATLWSAGEVIVTDDQVPDGCTAACLPEGTDSYTAICGDDADGDGSDLDPGEDCDDGDALSGDGCSSTCLSEGSSSTCGNNTVDDGEECDDGNTTSRDGCSSTCLNEGSSGGQTTCGDGVVTQIETLASVSPPSTWAGGEDCDYASSIASESVGCSTACVNEGSTAVTGIVGVCGDGELDIPAEQCDDGGTTSGNGCDERCLFEGSEACSDPATDYCCGDGTADPDISESCDDGNSVSGDGCSSSCLLEGSDATRSTPSWCGDAVLDDSEDDACEIDSGSLDTLIEDEQVAVIASTANGEVVDGLATAVVEAATGGGSGEAYLNLTCSCESDNACGEETIDTIGCGEGGCCYERPEVSTYTPPSGEACRNTLISLTFDQAMVSGSFEDNIVVTMELKDTETCPYSSTTALAPSSSGFLSRLWFDVSRFVASVIRPALADNELTDCEMPVTFVSETVTGGEQVSLIYEDLLEEDHDYTVTITGDPDHTGAGVRSANGVSLNEDYTFYVEVGDDICSFDAVRVLDADEDSSGLFTATNEEHDFTAEAVTVRGGTQEAIIPISGIYDWTWTEGWWGTDDEIVSVPVSGTDTSAGSANVVTAVGANGEAMVYASATITSDTLFDPSTEKDVLYGSTDVTANLCVNPWPALPSDAELAAGEGWGAFEDAASADADPDDDGTDEIAERVAYMNFSTYYCRDDLGQGKDEDGTTITVDGPAADAVAVEDPPSDVLKEYLFTLSDGDAIGIRVASNSDLLSIADWYEDQEFTGSPSITTVDGYEALTDGRTTYVSAGNVNSASSAGIIYGNVYVISYNEDASDETIAVFNQMLENWSFNTNLDNDQLCYESSGAPSTDNDGETITCTSDLGCSSGDCRADKDKLTRDLTRLTDFGAIQVELEAYGSANGRCSATTSTSCTEDDDCDDDETCQPLYPTVDSGSFLRSMTTSAWDSWQSELGADLGNEELATDPLNDYAECGAEGGTYANYNADTCWYEAPALYACPEGSHVYAYRNVGDTGYSLSTDLEYDYVTGTTEWSADLDDDYTDGLDLMAGLAFLDTDAGYQEDSTCDGTTYGSSVVCGDGVIGSAEACESGDTSTAKCTVETCVSTDADYDGLSCDDVDCADTAICNSTDTTTSGTRIVSCNSACTDYDTTSDAACVPYRCGNGVIDTDSGEACDDGSHNGDYGYCGTSCQWDDTAFYCGDGTLAGGESCDEGVNNGVYAASSADSCNATCDGLGEYCGDEVVNGSESCDGAETSTAALCYGGTDDGETCDSDSDCDSGICGAAYSCELTSEVSCDSLNDTTTCGDWGTCVVASLGTMSGGIGISGSFKCEVDGVTYCDGFSDSSTCESYNSALNCDAVASESYDACGEGTVCEDYSDVGLDCTDDTNCDSGDCSGGLCVGATDVGEVCSSSTETTDCDSQSCSSITYQLARSRACTTSCTVDGAWSDCVQSDDYCGNGTVDGSEECDDGNDSSNDACTNDCTDNICGDGYLYSGEESCDQGDDNGVVCDGLYGKTCRYCSDSCVYLTATGAYCGDGEVDVEEETCDPGDSGSVYSCYDYMT